MMRNKYCLGEFFSNTLALVITKVFYRPATIVKRPLYLRGRKSVSFGKNTKIGHSCRFDLDGKKKTLFIGQNFELGDYGHIVAFNRVEIGENVLVASKVFISDTNHGCYNGDDQDAPGVPPNGRRLSVGQVIIGNNVWIGENAVILAGSKIGDGCIIGANSVITKEIEGNSIVIGNNKVIKQWDEQKKQWIKV